MARALINVPPKAKKGEVFEIKTLLSHPMETGFRTGTDGRLVPRHIVTKFVCSFEGEPIFAADLNPAIAANPFLSFTALAERSGVLTFAWTDDRGETSVQTARIEVE